MWGFWGWERKKRDLEIMSQEFEIHLQCSFWLLSTELSYFGLPVQSETNIKCKQTLKSTWMINFPASLLELLPNEGPRLHVCHCHPPSLIPSQLGNTTDQNVYMLTQQKIVSPSTIFLLLGFSVLYMKSPKTFFPGFSPTCLQRKKCGNKVDVYIVTRILLIFLFSFSCSYWNSSSLGSGIVLFSNGTLCSHTKVKRFDKSDMSIY